MTQKPLIRLLVVAMIAGLTSGFAQDAKTPETAKPKPTPPTGYTDTPVIPGQKWRVHDDNRPRPEVVTPAETFSHYAAAPSDATVLFNGTDLSKWKNQKTGEPAAWKVELGYMEVAPKTGTIMTKQEFGDFQLHLEFATPSNKTYADGQAGAMYGQFPPLVNASKAPGKWQSYDIIFETPRWEGEKLVKKGAVTVIHNGVVLHHRKEFIGAVAHKNVGKYSPHPPKGPIVLQDHGNPMRFRNIWIRELGGYDDPES